MKGMVPSNYSSCKSIYTCTFCIGCGSNQSFVDINKINLWFMVWHFHPVFSILRAVQQTCVIMTSSECDSLSDVFTGKTDLEMFIRPRNHQIRCDRYFSLFDSLTTTNVVNHSGHWLKTHSYRWILLTSWKASACKVWVVWRTEIEREFVSNSETTERQY